MSSIIKSGSAPSNSPDGKYYLETDQACYAELKRGRTYIMTAQEVSKVSHYVVITNADFTVTFNGDSDLVQCGIKDNAIVMNVHRACRIDFAQGGNLEFKKGTADLDSRISMGANASGNVLVADSLPQQGDFAGQICSLTTGATYVWTGSEWSSTAGSSTLPTPTTTNKGNSLRSNGTSWVALGANRDKASPFSISDSSITTSDWEYFRVCKQDTNKSTLHWAFDLQIGGHTQQSNQFHIDIRGQAPSNNELIDRIWVAVTMIKSFGASQTGVNPSTHYTDWKSRIKFMFAHSTGSIYLCVMKTGSGLGATLFNGFDANACSVCTFDDITSYCDGSTPPETDLTDATLTEWFTDVPVSTAANQMLVSDGNGGWKTLRNKVLRDDYGSTVLSNGKYSLFKLAEITVPSTGSDIKFHFEFDMQQGRHESASIRTHWDIAGSYALTDRTGLTKAACVVTAFPSADASVGISNLYYGPMVYCREVQLCWKWKDDSQTVANLYLVVKPITSIYIKFTIFPGIADTSTKAFFDYGTLEEVLNLDDLTGYETTGCSLVTYNPILQPTSADNGKVLKVVSGVPTWASA